jgi:hypothetical protein
MSVGIAIVETMFDHGGVISAAASSVSTHDTSSSRVFADPAPGAEAREATVPGAPAAPGASAADTVRTLQSRIRQMQASKLDSRSIPTHPAIAELLPGGALKQGAVYSVDRSATLLMALLAGPSAAGSWCGVVGVPEFGVEAAARFGIDLGRLVLVPDPGEQWLAVTAAIADVMGVVVTRPPRRADDGSIARLAARLRQRDATLIVLGTWPQSEAMLSLSESDWTGIGNGHGHLSARQVTVTVTSRTHARPRSARLWLPDREAAFRSAGRAPQAGQHDLRQPDLRPVLREAAG